ncbi:MAG: NYN domain-containing protein [Limnospira sp.]
MSQTTNGTTAVHAIGDLIYQTLVFLYQNHPERLDVRYQKVRWDRPQYRTALLDKLTPALSQAKHREALFSKVRGYLKSLLSSDAIAAAEFERLKPQLEQLFGTAPSADNSDLNPATTSAHHCFNGGGVGNGGISILLLDAENIQLDGAIEKFLEKICHYPLQIRVAFANWRSMGKKDAEFHERGYQLIHVPAGKDSADLKMATVGSSIFVHYPTAREVLVCSSDRALIHLCNTLQSHGLAVYQVRKDKEKIIVFNSQNGTTETYSLIPPPAIPSWEEFLSQLQELIRGEQNRTNSPWVKLSKLSNLYRSQYKLTLSKVVSAHHSDYNVRDIFINNPLVFAVHQPSGKSQIYVTLFQDNSSPNNPSETLPQKPTDAIAPIASLSDLETALVELMAELTQNSQNSFVPLSILGSHFNKKHGQAITQLIRQFKASGKFPKFLESCPSFKLEKTEMGWQVCLSTAESVGLLASE